MTSENPIPPQLGDMPNPEIQSTDKNPSTEALVQEGVNRIVTEIVDSALARISDQQERQLVRDGIADLLGNTLQELVEEKLNQQQSQISMVGGMAIGDAVNTGINAAKQVQDLGFVEFTAGLINGTFDAIIAATIRQIEAYAELVANLAKTLKQFEAENVSDAEINAHLNENYPDGNGGTVVRANYIFPNTPRDPKTGNPGKAGVTKLQEVARALEAETVNLEQPLKLTITPEQKNSFTVAQVQLILRKLSESLAQSLIDHLREMARQGMARIVITDGEIFSKLTFNVTATETETRRKSEYDRLQAGAYLRASARWGWGRASVGANFNKLKVKATNESSFDNVTMSTEIIGQVKIRFRTETFPIVESNG
ncbi:hypothetical protein BJP34_30970 [Moorena producens PAL-8-15-08-1]|uniref:Uncharacterized protein n=1 Tax=Moorena producens PAL-8-15-08-1 TaxID=1458985 RepID=A0A1D8U0B5_9CYAN|nr:hypothetical protein [Moorena producens]AOX03275.1 hypothetical protein BJP34_30970 [Moorena producens PAL-8-15-08-1]